MGNNLSFDADENGTGAETFDGDNVLGVVVDDMMVVVVVVVVVGWCFG